MKIKFEHPPVKDAAGNKSLNPFKDFDPKNTNHYPKGPGIYIYGLKLNIDGKQQFVPLYVGKHNSNVGKRLFEHYYQEKMPGNSSKEIFDITKLASLFDVKNLYNAMMIYDSQQGKSLKRINNQELIWFNDKDFFDEYISRKLKFNGTMKVSGYISGSGHLASLFPICGDLDLIANKDNVFVKCIEELKNKIISSKLIFNENYYFVYSEIGKSNLGNIGFYENSTKLALQQLGIHTTAAAGKDADISSIELDNIISKIIKL